MHLIEIGALGLPRAIEEYQRGDRYPVEVNFPDENRASFRFLEVVPAEVMERLGQEAPFTRLSWADGRLTFTGQMTYRDMTLLREASEDGEYRRAVFNLYRMRQPSGQLIDVAGWESLAQRFSDGPRTGCIVRGFQRSGLIVQLDDGPIASLDAETASDRQVSIGETLEVTVVAIDRQRRRIVLSSAEGDPLAKYSPEQDVSGRITGKKPFGLFVEIEPGVRGLVHSTEMMDSDWTTEVNEQIRVRILSINSDRTLRLSRKSLGGQSS